jgi:cell division protein ZapD
LIARKAAVLVLYEYPFNESIRTMLRLEHLFDRLGRLLPRDEAVDHHYALATMFEIMDVASRADLKSDLLKELERQRALLQSYRGNPAISEGALLEVMARVDHAFNGLNQLPGKAGHVLTANEWLMSIRSRISIPGGTCEFDLPDYRHWLDQPFAVRSKQFGDWMVTIRPLCDAVTELLWLTREAARPKPEVATGGTFQITFDRENPCQLLRLHLPASTQLFPEISGSHHRCSIRFLSWNDVSSRPVQATEDVQFQLTICT